MTQTYDERRAARQERLDLRVEKLRKEAHAHLDAAHAIHDVIPFGQPILVGHHSEGRHRRDLARADRHMGKFVEAKDEADRLNAIAPTTGVLAADADAIEQIEKKIADRRAKQEFMVKVNKTIRRYRLPEQEGACAAELAKTGLGAVVIGELLKPDWAGRRGFASYQLTNNSGEIRRLEQRIEQLRRTKAIPYAEQTIKGVKVVTDPDAQRIRMVFPGKPAPDIIKALKGYGFRWSHNEGAWQCNLHNRGQWAVSQILALLPGPGPDDEPAATTEASEAAAD